MADITALKVVCDAGKKVTITAKTSDVTEVYMLDSQNIPTENMLLIQASRKQILQSINMQKMFINLGSCVDLLNITYHSVNGMEGGISKSVAAIQSDFLNVLTNSIVVMQGFESGTISVVNSLIKAFGYLTKPLYTTLPLDKNGVVLACKVFESVKQKAAQMRTASETIAHDYAAVRDKTSTTNGSIMSVRDKDYELRQAKWKELTQLQAQFEGYQDVKADLDSGISEYSTMYNQLAKKIDKQEERAFTLSLTSAILGGVAQFVGAVIPTGGGKAGSSSSAGDGKVDPAEQGAVDQKCTASEKEVKELQQNLEDNKKELTALKEELNKLSADDHEKKDELLKKQDLLEKEKKEYETALVAASSKAEVYKQAAGGAASGIQFTSDKLEKISEKADAGLDGMYLRLDNIAAQKAALAKERRETILKMASLTKSLEYASTEQHDLEIALNALIAAVGCMRLVEIYLADITLFWNNIESFCTRLIGEISSINEEASTFELIENYSVFFFDEDFIKLYLLNMLNWVALHSISTDYLQAFNHAFSKQKSVMGQLEMSREEHWKQAQTLAAGIANVFDQQLEDLT